MTPVKVLVVRLPKGLRPTGWVDDLGQSTQTQLCHILLLKISVYDSKVHVLTLYSSCFLMPNSRPLHYEVSSKWSVFSVLSAPPVSLATPTPASVCLHGDYWRQGPWRRGHSLKESCEVVHWRMGRKYMLVGVLSLKPIHSITYHIQNKKLVYRFIFIRSCSGFFFFFFLSSLMAGQGNRVGRGPIIVLRTYVTTPQRET